jgi:hypothetical protein
MIAHKKSSSVSLALAYEGFSPPSRIPFMFIIKKYPFNGSSFER